MEINSKTNFNNETSYFWGKPDISVKFCEKKYDTVFWIAEFYNTISAIIYILIGCFYYSKKLRTIAQITFFMGISTMIMHGTLRYYGQIMDETSLIILLYENFKRCYKIKTYIYLYPCVAVYLLFNEYYFVFLTIFMTFKISIIYYLFVLKRFKSHKERVFLFAYIFYMTIAFLCWLKDQLLCDKDSSIEYHALWHYFSGFAIFFGFLTYI